MKYTITYASGCIFAAKRVSKAETLEEVLSKEIEKFPYGERREMNSSLILERFMLQVSKENIPEALSLFRQWKKGNECF